ncbi:MG2 domain-containing protein [Sphingomonas sp. BT-65]|uniref:alpha-2-macroglobulin family protein n=1 Tax=Sphingomonas sp. BT-65 TaxID=2989821 RepID=UPI0022356E1D|nr:MG2 domain-containing protein [Sphingomonas sp. BT-65]MCW4462141.1 MG2 domain-containing protein [Sphingomonas sp. BT-65]
MKHLARAAAVLALALTPLAAWGDASPQVVLATPGMGDGAIERFTIRFSAPMVPLGDPRAAAPAKVTCPVGGEGRWIDQQTFVHEFASPLPGGTVCEFQLNEKLKSLSGYAVTGSQSFKVDAGGPTVKGMLPSRYGGQIEEDQVFLIGTNMPATRESIAAGAYCAVEGLGEQIPVELLDAGLPGKLLQGLNPERWEVRNFLSDSGIAEKLPDDAATRAKALASVVAVKCGRPLPPGRDVSLVWGASIAGAGGKTAGAEQRFDFTVRKPFTARFECSRVNPQAGCSPVQEAWVRFSARIPKELAEQVRIELPDGKKLTPTLSDDDKRANTMSDLKFESPLPASTTAKLVLPAGVKDESGRVLANAERFPLEVRFDEAPPLVKFAAPFGIIEAEEGGILPVTVRNVEAALQGKGLSVAGQHMRVDASDGVIAKWLRNIDKADDYAVDEVKRGEETIRINQTGAKPILTPGLGAPLNIGLPGKGKEFEVVGIPLQKPGFYVVELASPQLGQALLGRNAPRYVAAGALVTNMAVHFKWGREGSLAWVTSLDSGKPVGGAAVKVTDSCTGQALATGTTDDMGRLAVKQGIPEPQSYGSCEDGNSHPLMISARKGDDMSFTLTAWGEGIRPYDFDLRYGYEAAGEIVHTIFDRALVRQGEAVNMKHVLRRPVAQGFVTPAGFTGTLKLSHRGSDTSFELPVTVDASGVGETVWNVPQGAPMGDYDLQFVKGDDTIWTNQSIKVDEYKLPTMKASVAGPKEAAVKPKSLPLDLFVGYLSGGGASNLPVELRVGYYDGIAAPDGYDGYSFGGKAIAEGTKPLNGEGEEDTTTLPPMQTLPVTLGADGTARTNVDIPQTLDGSSQMRVEMDYQDANGEILTASRRVPIYASGVQLGVRTDGWLMKEDDLRLRFVALDTQGKPVKGQRVQVALYSREILTARRRLIGGFYAYENNAKTTKIAASCSATTDELGLAQCAIDPGVSGEVYAVATTEDASGNVARAVTSVWLAGEDDWWFGGDNGDRMDVIPEQQEYKSSDTARFQVRMPFRNATALVTVEREGVLSSFVTELSGDNPVVEVPMQGVYAPDVFVSVMAVRGRIGGWKLWWADLARRWNLPFFSREGAAPTATVDLAKPSYRLGIAKVKVGWEGHRMKVDVAADKERYAARDTATVALTVRNPDGKAAANADVAFVAVDEALLQLAPNESWDVLKAMMGERPISVLTSTAQTQVVGKRHYGRKAVEAGGGGGGDLSALNRENFQPVLLWKGKVPIGTDGQARLQVPLSDALSSFKLVAIALGEGGQTFGMGETVVRTAQDLSIFAGIPPLVRNGDFYSAGFTLRNGSDKPMKVTAHVELSPRVATGRDLTVEIPAGGAVPIAWNLTAPAGFDKLQWKVTAKDASGKAADAITVAQEIAPAVPVETWAATLVRVGEGGPVAIQPPAGALAGFGQVSVLLTDTLAPPLQGVRDYMAAYPYGCFEQRTSRAIVLGDMGEWNRLSGEMPVYLDSDGLLRYFPSDSLRGSEALTSYILSITAEAGLPIPDGPRGRMIEALKAVLDGRLRHEDYGDVRLQKVAAFAALARQGAANAAMLGQIGMTPQDMPTSTLADYIAALGKVAGLANGAQLRAAAEGVLKTRLVYEGTRIDLSDSANTAWWMMSSGDESVLRALVATLGRPSFSGEGPKMMVGAALRQQRGHWDTTTANAWGVIAARKFSTTYPASAVAGITTASLGGQSVTRSWPLPDPQRSFVMALPAVGQQTPLTLSQSGGAGPWAMVQVKAAVPLTQPLSAGYRLSRKTEVVQAKTKGVLTRGDVIRVTLTVEATADRNWVVIADPVPAGATVLGSLGGQSEMLAEGGEAAGAQPSYVERGRDTWRGYFAWLPRGTHTVTYVMRLNAAGRMQLPPSKVEAMYSPEIRAAVPNQPMVIAQR